jgi:hypothetical protein
MSYAQAERLLEMAKTPPGQPSETSAISLTALEALRFLLDHGIDDYWIETAEGQAAYQAARSLLSEGSTPSSAMAPPKCMRCDYPNCFCKDAPPSTTGHKR